MNVSSKILIACSSILDRRFLSSFFGPYPARSDTCDYNGLTYRCSLSFFCWMSGGKSLGSCGNSFFTTCCVSPRNIVAVRAASSSRYHFPVEKPSNFHNLERNLSPPVKNEKGKILYNHYQLCERYRKLYTPIVVPMAKRR